jgi:polar amino acid transport system permease protein
MALDARIPAREDGASRALDQGMQSQGAAPGPARVYFRQKVWLTWALLCVLLGAGFYRLHLDFSYVGQKLPFLLGLRLSPDGFIQGAVLTVFVTGSSMICALVIAFLTALGRLARNPVAFAIATFYASLFRGTPLLVQVLIIYLALPQIGVVLGGLTSGLIALSLNYGAYLAETIRSGLMAVPAGQREAAMALGLPRWVAAWKIIAPQALRLIIPPAGALFVSMLKDSSLVSLMGLWELSFLAQSYARSTYHYLEMLLAAAVIYWGLSIVFEVVQMRLESRLGKGVVARADHGAGSRNG